MKRKKILAVGLLTVCLLGGWLFHRQHLLIAGTVYSRGVESIVLTHVEQAHMEKLPLLERLASLDIRGARVAPETVLELQRTLPGCEILWMLDFQGKRIPGDTRELSVTALTEADVAALAYLPQLSRVDARACPDYPEILRLRERLPQCQVAYALTLAGTVYDSQAREVTCTTLDEAKQALACLPNLERIQMRDCTEYGELARLREEQPQCGFVYDVTVGSKKIPWDTKAVQLAPEDLARGANALVWLPNLEYVKISGVVEDVAALKQLRQAYPELTVDSDFLLAGKTVNTLDTRLDLSGISLENTQAVDTAMSCFYQMETVEMHHCGIPNEEMEALRNKWTETEFIWTVQIGWIPLRTDVTYFMPYQYHYEVTDEDCVNLKYCRDIICLDLGHMPVTNLPSLAYLTKMEYLILACTHVSDISFCANMPNLKFLELFANDVTDYSPLLACKKLEDLNICYHYPKEEALQQLSQMTQLKHLWLRNYGAQPYQQRLRDALPNTVLKFGDGSSTGGGWRTIENYYKMRDVLGMPYFIED